MHSIRKVAIAFVVLTVMAGTCLAQEQVNITIDSITTNYRIVGNVIGLTESARKKYKVIVYVKTNQWYIHPYAQGGDGKSWASIASDGSWTISTVKREFAASAVAALVVPMESESLSPIPDVNDLPHAAILLKILQGSADLNKL